MKQTPYAIPEQFNETGSDSFCFVFDSTKPPSVISSLCFTDVNVYRYYSEPKVELFHFENVPNKQSSCSGRLFHVQGSKEERLDLKKNSILSA